ncbi:hypothetical protein D3C81_1818430 [compost metagenome]
MESLYNAMYLKVLWRLVELSQDCQVAEEHLEGPLARHFWRAKAEMSPKNTLDTPSRMHDRE